MAASWRRSAPCAAAVVLLVACGSSTAGPGSGGAPGNTPRRGYSAHITCPTANEMSDAAGIPVGADPGNGKPSHTQCQYPPATPGSTGTVTISGDAGDSARFARYFAAVTKTHLDAHAVTGLGDEAFADTVRGGNGTVAYVVVQTRFDNIIFAVTIYSPDAAETQAIAVMNLVAQRLTRQN